MTEQYAVVNGWLVANVGHHTCAGGTAESGYAHEPGCGQEPIARVEDLLKQSRRSAKSKRITEARRRMVLPASTETHGQKPAIGQVASRVIPANVVPRPPQPRRMGYPWPLDPIEVAELQQMREDYCEAAANRLSQQGSDFDDAEDVP